MSKDNTVMELVNTRINGNKIKGNKTYEDMLKRVTKEDIKNCSYNWGNVSLYGSKLEMIEQLKNICENRNSID